MASPRWAIEAAVWRLIEDPEWPALRESTRSAVLTAAGAADERAMTRAMATAVGTDPERLRPLWRHVRDIVAEATRGSIGVGAGPSPGHSWWRCSATGCTTPPALGSTVRPYAAGTCPTHGALVGPFVTRRDEAGHGHG
jgi:hypothetical protein